MAIRIIPFHDELLPQAGELLAQRHQRDRLVFPSLPPQYEAPAIASRAIHAALQRTYASGFAALEGDRLVAYLVGDMALEVGYFGRSGWIRPPGCAYDPAYGVEIVRDLYAIIGGHWLSYGAFFHFAVLPISDPALLNAWYSLSFGIQQVHALTDLETLELKTPDLAPQLEIRKAGPEDRQILADLSDVIWKHQVQAPVWAVIMPEAAQETREGWASLVDEPDATVWLAFQNGEVVGSQGYWPAETSDENLFVPQDAMYMSVAGTKLEARGKGVSTALSYRVLSDMRSKGVRYCETNWRSTNLLASRFWPRMGYQPVAYRLTRLLDPRIAWANGSVQS